MAAPKRGEGLVEPEAGAFVQSPIIISFSFVTVNRAWARVLVGLFLEVGFLGGQDCETFVLSQEV